MMKFSLQVKPPSPLRLITTSMGSQSPRSLRASQQAINVPLCVATMPGMRYLP